MKTDPRFIRNGVLCNTAKDIHIVKKKNISFVHRTPLNCDKRTKLYLLQSINNLLKK